MKKKSEKAKKTTNEPIFKITGSLSDVLRLSAGKAAKKSVTVSSKNK